MPGIKFLLGLPSLLLLSQMPTRPAHHHTIPMEVCCRSLWTQGPPQRCSVKVLTHPQAAITHESKNSWLRPERFNHNCPTKSRMVIMIP